MSNPPKEGSGTCRKRLIQAATEAFLEEGYRASVDRIAARAGVAKQSLYNNFANKEELFREVGSMLAEAIGEELRIGRDDLRRTLYNFGRELRERSLSDKGISIYRSFHIESGRVPEMVTAIHCRVVKGLTERIGQYLAQAMERGELRRDDPSFAAEMLMSMLVHADRMKRLGGEARLDADAEETRMRKIVDCFMTAYRAEPMG